jgi:hypothetical protein
LTWQAKRKSSSAASMSQVPAQFKKQNGALTLSAEGARAVLWRPSSGDAAPVNIPLLDITSTPGPFLTTFVS